MGRKPEETGGLMELGESDLIVYLQAVKSEWIESQQEQFSRRIKVDWLLRQLMIGGMWAGGISRIVNQNYILRERITVNQVRGSVNTVKNIESATTQIIKICTNPFWSEDIE